MSDQRKTSYAVKTTVLKDGRVKIDATVEARFHKATGDNDGWAKISFKGTTTVEALAEYALHNRKLGFTSNIRREAELTGKFEDATPKIQDRYVGLLKRAEKEGVNFSAPVIQDPEKAQRATQTAWDNATPEVREQIMVEQAMEKSGKSEKEVREMLTSMELI